MPLMDPSKVKLRDLTGDGGISGLKGTIIKQAGPQLTKPYDFKGKKVI